jgi:ATP-dependent Clp protease ATP-binding subunit ClpB
MAGRDTYEAMKDAVLEIVGKHFRPEFLNRIDEVVVFHSLEAAQIRAIAALQVARLRDRLRAQNIELTVTDAALDKLGQSGFDPVYGARPLKRAIQANLETPLATKLLAGEFHPGDSVAVDVHNDTLAFTKVRGASAPNLRAAPPAR